MTRYDIYWNGLLRKCTFDARIAEREVDEYRKKGGTVRKMLPINDPDLHMVHIFVSNNNNPEEE